MGSEFILGIDIGTSGVRAALYDLRGKLRAHSLVCKETVIVPGPDGAAEIDADVLFAQFTDAVDRLCEKMTEGKVIAVASSAFWHSLLGIDETGRPTAGIMTWADTRSRDLTEKLRKRFDELSVHKQTGARFHSSFWPAKLLWLRNRRPEAWQKTSRWLSFSDYVHLKLLGNTATSISMASGTGIFDLRNLEWYRPMLRFLRVKSSSLPDLANGNASPLLPAWQKRWPRLAHAKWLPAIADGAANNIGSGCTAGSEAALMIGTSGAMRVVYKGDPPDKIPAGLFCYRIDRKRVVLGGALSDGGGLYLWLKRTLRIDLTDEEIGREMARRGADAHGLTVMPFFFGERSTGYNEAARGAVIGLTASHDAIDILQAAMEAVAFRFAAIFDEIKTIRRIREIVVSGGALARSPVWTQIIADVLGCDLIVSNEPEASMRGAVLLALESLGKIDAAEAKSTEKTGVKFHPKCHEIYKMARKRHTDYYDRSRK